MRLLGLILSLCLLELILAADNVKVTVTSNKVSDPIPSDYVGFSFEVSGILAMTGRSPSPPKASFVQLLKNLKISSTGPGPNLRIGGNSADESWWDPNNTPKPPGINYDITSIDLISVNNVVKESGGSIVFDVDFRQATDPNWAVNHVKAIVQYVGFDFVDAIEIGNECDLYADNGIRPKNFTYDQYQSQWFNYVTAINAIPGVPRPRIQGATFCCLKKDFDDGIPSYLNKYHQLLKSFSYHRYPLDHCNGKVVTAEELLRDSSSAGQASLMAPFAKASNALGVPFRIGEGNSVACGGMPGVSNVFVSTLWAVDFLFNMATVNVKRVNFHGGAQSTYTAIGYATNSATVPDVRPLYYALWLIAETTQNGATVVASNVQSSNPLIKAWSVSNAKNTYVVLIHKDIAATSNATVTVTPAKKSASSATLAPLFAKGGPHQTYGVSFGGQTFDGSRDGKPVGARVVTNLPPNSNGDYTFELPVATIAVLTIPN